MCTAESRACSESGQMNVNVSEWYIVNIGHISCGIEQWRLTFVVCRAIANNETHLNKCLGYLIYMS
jgi:hypothetical protein